jgi:hypothetical protein
VKYMILINLGPEARNWQSLPEDEQKQIVEAWGTVNQTPGITPGLQLQPPETATTVRAAGGQIVTTDGPYIETKEALDGYCVLEADDLDAAIELAGKIPALHRGGAVEIRPIVEWSQA